MLAELVSEQHHMTIADMEAGLEHLSRSDGTLRFVDMLLVVMEPYRKALETARRTNVLALELGIPHIYGIANKIADDEDRAVVREFAEQVGLSMMAEVPFDDAVRIADRDGKAVIDVAPDGPAATAVARLLDAVEATWATV